MSIPKPSISFHPPVYVCKHTTKAFTLDGNIEKEFWNEIPFTADFTDIEGDLRPSPRFRTRAKMQWDDENLYIAALLEGDEIWATITERDTIIFNDNDFEIFIDPDSDTHHYYEFEMNALGTVWDLLLTKAYRDGGLPINSWDIQGLRTEVYINGELGNPAAPNCSWSVEVVMPFASLQECAPHNGPPLPGEYWRMNFSRVQWKVDVKDGSYQKKLMPESKQPYPEDNWVWSPTGLINIHYPELWGFVFFEDGNGANNYSIPENELIKWRLRQFYYASHQYYEEHGCFTNDLAELISGDMDGKNVTIETTAHTFEISTPASEGGTIRLFSDGKVIYCK